MAFAQQVAEVVAFGGEEAGVEAAIGGHSDAGAVAAKGLGLPMR